MTREQINERIIEILEQIGIIPKKSPENQETS